ANTSANLTGHCVILRGGDTWVNADFPWSPSWVNTGASCSGDGGSRNVVKGTGCVYWGVDPTWFVGTSWTRPILNPGGAAIAATGGNGADGNVIDLCRYCIWDNFEITGLFFGTDTTYAHQKALYFNISATDIEVKNFYIHGWSHSYKTSVVNVTGGT